jgi:homoserine dehydrogenase
MPDAVMVMVGGPVGVGEGVAVVLVGVGLVGAEFAGLLEQPAAAISTRMKQARRGIGITLMPVAQPD